MAEKKNGRKTSPTQEMLEQILRKQDRHDRRLKSIETQQTLMLSALQRQGQLTEDVNRRCMEKLGLKCPLNPEDEEEEENGG